MQSGQVYESDVETLEVAGVAEPWMKPRRQREGTRARDYEGPFNEEQEIELASELLDVRSETGLDAVFKKLGQTASSRMGRALSPAMAAVVRQAWKFAIQKCGLMGVLKQAGLIAPPGSARSTVSGHPVGLELEGLSAEDRDFEVAKQLVRFAGAAVGNLGPALPGCSPRDAVLPALVQAAERFAPGLVSAFHPPKKQCHCGCGGSCGGK